jgi:TPR repeat protein
MLAVGRSYENGAGVTRDYDQAMAWYRKAADAGCADAMNSIGGLYERGLGVRQSRWMASRWYKRAIRAGSALARSNLDTLKAG